MDDFLQLYKNIIKSVEGLSNILIVIKGSPDPDALGSSFAMMALLETIGVSSKIVAEESLHLSQNRIFTKELNLPVEFEWSSSSLDRYDGYAILDFQSVCVKSIGLHLPCIVHIDHHEEVLEDVIPRVKFVSHLVGSTCTIMSLVLKESKVALPDKLRRRIFSALMYGIQTDTDKYEHATPLDFEAYEYIVADADLELIEKIDENGMARCKFCHQKSNVGKKY